jgi:AbrB family looped-hinge helix DNA binding protein
VTETPGAKDRLRKSMRTSSTLSSKCRITIPKTIREKMGWRPGEKIAFFVKAGGVLMVRIPEREELVGMARGANVDGYRDRKDRF